MAFFDPFSDTLTMQREMARVQDEINRLFGGLARPLDTAAVLADQPAMATKEGAGAQTHPMWRPRMDVWQQGNKLCVRAELAGVRKEDITVELRENVLHLSGTRKPSVDVEPQTGQGQQGHRQGLAQQQGDLTWFARECHWGRFHRAVRLPPNVREDSIVAKFTDGLLELTMEQQRPKEHETRAIEIK
jgi:HSP20 family protein